MATDTLAIATWLCEQRGCSLIPIDHPAETNQTDPRRVGKVPRLKTWAMFQETRPTPDNLRAWFGNGHRRNIGLVTGAVSNLVMVDCDSPEALAWADTHLPPTQMVTRTAKGEHRGYRHPGVPVRNKARVKTGDPAVKLDVRADGGYVVAPGSVHVTGVAYERAGTWPPVDELPVFDPTWLEHDAGSTPEPAPPAAADSHSPPTAAHATDPDHVRRRVRAYLAATPAAIAGQGGDAHTYVVACRLVQGFALSEAEALDLLRDWNATCVPPWTEEELAAKIRNASKYANGQPGALLDAAPPTAWPARARATNAPRRARQGAPPAAAEEPPSQDFIRTEKGVIVASSITNVRVGLVRLSLLPTYDSFARCVCLNGEPLEDDAIERLWVTFDDTFGFRPSRDLLRTVLVADGFARPVHPVRRYLEALTWDGVPRLDTWLSAYGGARPCPYVNAVGALPLVAAVRRVNRPGAKFDELLVLESPQGKGKSSALRALCADDDWFSDDLPLGADSKQTIERTAGRWLLEAAELHGNRGREAEQLKAFLSRQVDGPVRLAYGRLPTTVPRQFVLIGTTNASAAYLKDQTGARRFWPVTVTNFDVAALTRDRDQLWAEAAAREAAGASLRLDPALWATAAAHQEDRRASDPWEDLLSPLLEGDKEWVEAAVLWQTLGVDASYRDNRHADRVAAIVQRHGYVAKRKRRVLGVPTWGWTRTPDQEDE